MYWIIARVSSAKSFCVFCFVFCILKNVPSSISAFFFHLFWRLKKDLINLGLFILFINVYVCACVYTNMYIFNAYHFTMKLKISFIFSLLLVVELLTSMCVSRFSFTCPLYPHSHKNCKFLRLWPSVHLYLLALSFADYPPPGACVIISCLVFLMTSGSHKSIPDEIE